ncbi:MAG TPA: tetratricopeptide repeat protein [Caulobacter sp.]|nr:tetratricopeptide repeat protein [Caulobacter sp.]
MADRYRSLLAPSLAALSLALAGGTGAAAQDFEAVMAAPDDVELNLAYARDQARQGNLSAAASALERVLIQEPNRHGDRLFYAVVLYRLGDLQGAKSQLERLKGANLSPLQRAEADRYLERIEDRSADSSISGRITVGAVYEEDAAGAYFTNFDIFGAPPKEDGTSSELSLALNGRVSLGATKSWEIYGAGLAYDRSELSGAAVDFQRFELEGGVGHRARLTSIRVGLISRHVRLQGDPQLTELGLRAVGSWRVTNRTTLGFRAEGVSQDYDEPAIDTVSSLIGGTRDGERYLVGASVTHRLAARTAVTLGLEYEVKTAEYEPFGYLGPRVSVALDQRFRRGAYILASGSVRWLEYDEPDPFFLLGNQREDTRGYARLAVGAPLSAFSSRGVTGDVREDLVLEGALTYGSRESTSPLADFEGWGAELRLIWRFGARN